MKGLVKQWQIIAWAASALVGAGIAFASLQAKQSVTERDLGALERRVEAVETVSNRTQAILERIDERTKNILERLGQLERKFK